MTQQNEDDVLDFSVLLASCAHDMKNSLSMLMTSLEDMMLDQPAQNDEQRRRYAILRGEASRINNDLVSLLGVFRSQRQGLRPRIEEVFVKDFLEDQLAVHGVLLEARDLVGVIDCEDDLRGYFDVELIAGVIGNVLVNAARYARGRIVLGAAREGNGLCITVADDGNGFPPAMLRGGDVEQRIRFSTGSTQLGLYFASLIAGLHESHGQRGSISLDNAPSGGGVFTLKLP